MYHKESVKQKTIKTPKQKIFLLERIQILRPVRELSLLHFENFMWWENSKGLYKYSDIG